MLRHLSLHNVGPAPEMSFQPSERLNVITGDNGLGKSFLLELAWWAVTRTWAGQPIQPPHSQRRKSTINISFDATTKRADLSALYDVYEQRWRFPQGQPGQPGLVVYARVDGDFAVWDSNRRFGGYDEEESGVPKGLIFGRNDVWDGLVFGEKPICNGLLADWVRWQQTSAWEFSALKDILAELSPSPEEPVRPGRSRRVDVMDSRLIPTLAMPYGQDVPVTIASAGMRRVLALAYLLVWAWREHLEVSRIAGRPTAPRMLVIIDEVECHLHPKWQKVILSSIVSALDNLTTRDKRMRRAPDIQYLVTTHSPLVLASLEPIFRPVTDALFELVLEKHAGDKPDQVELLNPAFVRRGDAESWLTNTFELSSSRSIPAEALINEAAKLMQSKGITAEKCRKMQARLEAILPDIDPFWLRWRALTSAIMSGE